MGDRGHNRHGPKEGGCCAPFAGELGPHLTQCGLGRGLLPYQVASSYIQPFGHNRHGPKSGWGLHVPFFSGEAGPHITQSPGPRPTSIPSGILVHPAVSPQRTWAEDLVGPFMGEGAGSPSNTMSPRLRPISVPSGILMHTAVWPQQIWAENF